MILAPTSRQLHAGSDKVVTLPGSSVTLDGSLSEDYNGTIASYEWTKLSALLLFNINTPGSTTTLVNNLVLGCIPLN